MTKYIKPFAGFVINQSLDQLSSLQTPIAPPFLLIALVPKSSPLTIISPNHMCRPNRTGNMSTDVPRRIPGRDQLARPIDLKPLNATFEKPITQLTILAALHPDSSNPRSRNNIATSSATAHKARKEWAPADPLSPPLLSLTDGHEGWTPSPALKYHRKGGKDYAKYLLSFKKIAILLAVLFFIPFAANAQVVTEFPKRPIQIIVEWSAGASDDLRARALAPRLSEVLGQPVVLVNKPGAAATLSLSRR
jgi:hypothetical protein